MKSGSPGQLTTSVMSSQAERSWARPSAQGQHLLMEAKSAARVCDTRKDPRRERFIPLRVLTSDPQRGA